MSLRTDVTIGWLSAGTLLLGLGGCAASLSDVAPANCSLTGTWRLDPARSTDSRKVLAKLEAPQRPSRGISNGSDDSPAPYHRSRGGGRGGSSSSSENGSTYLGDSQGPEQQPYRPPVDIQAAELRGGTWLRIEQRPDEMIIDNGLTTRSFTPGVKSVVSVSSGVADQISGWKGRDYYIQIRPQVGPSIKERYRLSDDRKQLTETIEISSEGRVPGVSLTRVYVPADELPSVVPGD